MIYVVAVVVRESKAIAKLNYFHYRERIFAVFVMCVCVCVCVCVCGSIMDNRQINSKPECCGFDIYCRTEQNIMHNHTN
jgi:hypothetical protein